MKRIAQTVVGIGICVVFVFTAFSLALSAEVPRTTKEELKTLIEKGKVVVLDVRTPSDWASSKYKVHTAIRENPDQVKSWAKKFSKDQRLVLYCG